MFRKAMTGLTAGCVLGAVLGFALTAPAAAKSKARLVRPGPINIPAPAYGYRGDGRAHSPTPSLEVYVNGKYSGTDPDPFIRNMLAIDPPWNRTR